MSIATETREALRNSVIETLLSTFPGAQKVMGGVAFLSEMVDEETGMLFPVELKVAVKHTQDTARSKAYDLEAEVQKAANRPGRRTADPVKAAKVAAEKEASAARKAANLAILRDWLYANLPATGMTPSAIKAAIPEFEGLTPMMVGTLLKTLNAEGVVDYTLDEARHKVYTLAK